jgi:hypothetical protein
MIALNDASWEYFQNLLDTFVFNKLNTASGEERASWNRQALQSFFDTFGFGVGNGSARASSFPVAVLASLGIFGAILFGTFLFNVFFSSSKRTVSDPLSHAAQLGAKSMCLAWLISSSISNPQIDLGLSFYIFAAVACSKASSLPVRTFQLQSWERDGSRTAVTRG